MVTVSLATESLDFLRWLMSGNPFRSCDSSLVITWQRLGYIRSRRYILYLSVFVVGRKQIRIIALAESQRPLVSVHHSLLYHLIVILLLHERSASDPL